MHNYINTPFTNLVTAATRHNQAYYSANPFPYICFEKFFCPQMLDQVPNEFPNLDEEDVYDGTPIN